MSGIIKVGIADLKIAKGGSTLITIGLGSCVGICIYDPVAKIGGLAHIMLPDSNSSERGKQKLLMYADTAIPVLVERMLEAGASRERLVTKIAGGATMFSSFGKKESINIGEQNVAAVKKALHALNLKITSEDTGKNFSRTVEFYIETGTVLVRTGHGEMRL
ncbi:MAG: chemotaxis protein CheD [Candidatus Syntrophoarchaeum caldarius]|uniref:Probable chemoreceptor glutamine deamidase CheD n=1 Tax=Candidatus Syntropharchaeum caldarium TaxID=1838285 RepID=A0A1F2PAS4_9EURY|nr:MAG: chemotaxis protein CheD [Candidatus Syntrophoarchaeum caldarius]